MTKIAENNKLSKQSPTEVMPGEFAQKDLDVLFQAGIIPAKTPPEQVRVFARVCAERGLSPFSKQIYLTSYNTKEGPKYSVITGIDGFRAMAARSGVFAGADTPKFNMTSQGLFFTAAELVGKGKKAPISCTVTVYRIVQGHRVGFTAECLFDEYAGRDRMGNLVQKWATMPYNMIAKCAEAKAYKKAFPDQVGGLSIPEERAAWEDTNTGMSKEVIAQTIEDREELLEQVKATIEGLDLAGLKRFYNDNPLLVEDGDILNLLTARKEAIKTQSNG
jgi:phage recombination protein Bet